MPLPSIESSSRRVVRVAASVVAPTAPPRVAEPPLANPVARPAAPTPVARPVAPPPVATIPVVPQALLHAAQTPLLPTQVRHVTAGLIFASEYNQGLGYDVRLRRSVNRGDLHRVRRGVYFSTHAWEQLNQHQRYVARVRGAVLATRQPQVLSHQSAAALWGLPLLVAWPNEVHFVSERARGGRSDPGIRRHAIGVDPRDIVLVDEMLVTSVARTVLDLAATLDLKSAVAAADRAIHVDRFGRTPALTTKAELLSALERMLPFRGSVRARAVIEFAKPNSDSPNESGSRVSIALNGFPEPVLQHPFIIRGKQVETDFYWSEYDAIGEADGRGKYLDPRMLGGKTTQEVVLVEKEREDALRRQVRAFTRWDFATGMSKSRLRTRLLEMGLPAGRPKLPHG